MAESDMNRKVARGLFWKLLENGGAQGVQFVIAILLARLLSPAQYGVVGLIMIFITIANVFVQSGFSTALVQKRQADPEDFSSVCYFELAAVRNAVPGGAFDCILLRDTCSEEDCPGTGGGAVSRGGDLRADRLCVPEDGI